MKKPQKKRAEWDKRGKYKFIIWKIGEVHRDIKAIQVTLRYLIKGLEHEFMFDKAYIWDAVCQDEIDRQILEELSQATIDGLLPREISRRVGSRKTTPWKVTQRLRRINKRLERLIGQKAAEKRGMCWALTSFMERAWGSTKQEAEEIKKEEEDLTAKGEVPF